MENERKYWFLILKCQIILSLLFGVLSAFSQKIKWDKPIQGGSECYSVDVDSQNMVYFAGTINGYEGSAIFNGTSLPINMEDGKGLFIAKSDSNYNHEWIKVIESSWAYGYYPQLKVDNSDNLILAGVYYDRFKVDDLDLVETDHNPRGFVAKFNSDGKLLWFKSVTLDTWALLITDLAIDNENNIYFSGNYSGNLTFNNKTAPDTVISSNFETGFIAKYDGNGHFHWATSILSNYQLNIKGIAVDHDQNLYLTGWVYGDASFGTNSIFAYNSDIFIAKYDKNQNNVWVKSFGKWRNTVLEAGFSIAMDKTHEHIYVTGSFAGTVDFGGFVLDSDDKHIFLAKYSNQGDLNWVRNAGNYTGMASYIEKGVKFIVDNQDFVFVAGDFESTGFFGDTTIVAYGDKSGNYRYDNFVAKYYANGDFSWVTHLGSWYEDIVYSIQKDNYNNIFVVGSTLNKASFGDFRLDSEYHSPGYIGKIKDRKEENRQEIILKTSVDTLSFSQGLNSSSAINIRSNIDWHLSSNKSWLTLSQASGKGNSSVSVTPENNEGIERYAIITLSGSGAPSKTVFVKQEGLITGNKRTEYYGIEMFPNPVRNVLHFGNANGRYYFISIHDLQGRVVIPNGILLNNQLNLRDLANGVYVVQIDFGDKMLIKKLVKE